MIDGVPLALSGTEIIEVANRQMLFIEEYTGLSIGSVGIAARFQPALLFLTAAEVCGLMSAEGGDASSMALGDFSTSKGSESNISVLSRQYREMGMSALDTLGAKTSYYQAFG
jgi:hypothetical protein